MSRLLTQPQVARLAKYVTGQPYLRADKLLLKHNQGGSEVRDESMATVFG